MSSYGQITALGGNKYSVGINALQNQVDFEIDKPCAGLLMTIKQTENIFLRVHYEDESGKRNALVNEIALEDYLCLTQRLSERVNVREIQLPTGDEGANETHYQFLLLFSFNGDLHLDDDHKLIVQLFQKEVDGEDFVDVPVIFENYCFGQVGYPIVLEKQRILQSNDFAHIDALGFDYVYIPKNTNFAYVQYDKGTFNGTRRTTQEQMSYDAFIYDNKNDISHATGGLLVDTRQKTEFVLSHLNESDIHIYKVDCVRESNQLRTVQAQLEQKAKAMEQASELAGAVKSNVVKEMSGGNQTSWTPPFSPGGGIPRAGMTLGNSSWMNGAGSVSKSGAKISNVKIG